jgi:hypothetical protein
VPVREIKIYCLIQSEHKITLHFQNDTENNCCVLRTSNSHQSIEKNSRFVSYGMSDSCCFCAPPLDATSFKYSYPTTEELVCSALSQDLTAVATCISHAVSLAITQPSEIVCEMYNLPLYLCVVVYGKSDCSCTHNFTSYLIQLIQHLKQPRHLLA